MEYDSTERMDGSHGRSRERGKTMKMHLEVEAPGIWKGTTGTPEKYTPVTLRQFPVRQKELEDMGEAVLPETARQIDVRPGRRGLELVIPMAAEEEIYGLGLQLHSVGQARRKRMLRVNSDPVVDRGESHAPVPFFVSTAGYGLFIDTFHYVEMYLGTNQGKGFSHDRARVNEKHREITLEKNREASQILIDLKGVDGLNLYLFAGTVKEVVCRYNLFSGGGCLPPMWGLGVWYRVYGGGDQETVVRLAEEFRKEAFPMDVLGLEPGWHSHSYACTYQWSYLFPHPEEMIRELRRKGYRLNLWEHAFVHPKAPFYQEMLPWAGEYEVWGGIVPDFLMPEAIRLFADHHRRELVEKGIAGFKLDECDNSDMNSVNWSFPDTAYFPSGMDGEQMHMAFGLLYQQVMLAVFHEENRRTYAQVRSSGALAAPFPFVLYSDLYDHRQYIRGMVTSGFCGLLWTPEVRSCKSGEDFLRRMETVMFSAQAVYNCWRIPHPPWKQVDHSLNLEGKWMENSAYYTKVCRNYHQVRMSLLPYLYSAFVTYYRKGVPPVRALIMDFEDDPAVWGIEDEYMLGDLLLVAPLTLEDGTGREVYLPEGTWYDFWEDTAYEGGRSFSVHADYDRIPVFVRGGSILPLAKPVECVAENTVFELVPRIYGEGHFELYEDDFETFNYEQGKTNLIELYLDENGKAAIKRSGDGPIRYRLAPEISA